VEGDERLRTNAEAFLATYLFLIRHPSDLSVALSKDLVPRDITWEKWRALARGLEVSLGTAPDSVREFSGRWHFGELRLSRLNLVMIMTGRNLRGYKALSTNYSSYFSTFTVFLSLCTAIFFSVALSAFQVSLAANAEPPMKLRHVAYWFGNVTLILLALVILLPMSFFVILFLHNARFAYKNSRSNAKAMGPRAGVPV